MKYHFFLVIVIALSDSVFAQKQEDNSMSAQQAYQMIEELHKEVQYRNDKIFYDLKVFNGACNYKIWVNDMPVFAMYNNARGELSFPINTEILKSGKQTLKIRIFPFLDVSTKTFDHKLNKYAGLDVEIREMEWDAQERKFDYYPIFTYQTPREGKETLQDNPREFLFEEEEELPFYEETVEFEAKVPYNLVGWSKSVDLTKENQEELLKEVESYYKNLASDFDKKNVKSIAKKYLKKEKEIAQCFFHNETEAQTRWKEDIIKEIIDPNSKTGKVEKYEIFFFGNGKVIALMRFPGKSPLYLTIPDENGAPDYYVYDIFLHRPKPGAPLEIIR